MAQLVVKAAFTVARSMRQQLGQQAVLCMRIMVVVMVLRDDGIRCPGMDVQHTVCQPQQLGPEQGQHKQRRARKGTA